jgi:hypothetical protein
MNRRIFQNSAFLIALYNVQPLQRKFHQIRAISDIAIKIVQGRVAVNNVHRQKLRHYKQTIRFLANQRISTNRKKRRMLAFHDVIPLLIKPILHLLDEQ